MRNFALTILFFSFHVAGSAASVVVASSANTSTLGRPVTLTASITPATATGTITFYNGVEVLGIRSVLNGVGQFTASLLPSGIQSIKARYNGDSSNAAGISSPANVTVKTIAASGFRTQLYTIPTPAGVPSSVVSVAVADFDSDGKADLVVANQARNNISILQGNGDGTFQAAVDYASANEPCSLAVSDFNGDGKPDIVVTSLSGPVQIFLGNGDRTFQPGVNVAGGTTPFFVVVADFDGNGKTDLAVANRERSVSILKGNGDGSFQSAVFLGLVDPAVSLAVGDFDNDGKADLSVYCGSLTSFRTGKVIIRLGDGGGGFREAGTVMTNTVPGLVAVGDFNRDGRGDLAVSDAGISGVYVALGNGDGSFQSPVYYYSGPGASSTSTASVAVCDFDGDGIEDLVAGSRFNSQNSLHRLVGKGDGTFVNGGSIPLTDAVTGTTGAIVSGDFSGDGRTDIAIAQGLKLAVLTGLAEQTIIFGPLSDVAFGSAPPPLVATASSGLPVSFSSNTKPVCTVSGSTIKVLTGGTCTIVAAQPGDSFYGPAISLARSFVIVGGVPLPSQISNAAAGPPSVVSLSSYVAIYGNALSEVGNPSAPSLPLPTTLNGAQASLGGKPMPLLYAANGQINSLVPQGLAPGQTYPLVVTTSGGQSAPVSVKVLALQPGIYTVNSQGYGAAVVTNAVTGQLISETNRAHAGDYLVIYATGLGAVRGKNGEAPPADGASAPTDVIYSTKATVTATVGDVTVPVLFSGLTPTLAGLYQVNIQLPAGISPSPGAPVVITATDPETGEKASSNTPSISIQ